MGGINTHIVLEGVASTRRHSLAPGEQARLASRQDAELCLLSAPSSAALGQQVAHLRRLAPRLSQAEVTDLAAHLASTLVREQVRAAVVARSPATLAQGLETLDAWCAQGVQTRLDTQAGVYLGQGPTAPRLGFLFPGQGSPAHISGGLWRQRFASVQALYAQAALPEGAETVQTAVAQPAIVTASLAGLRVLDQMGLQASIAVGHSLGELVGLHWAGAFDASALLRMASARGQAMTALARATGSMASIAAGAEVVQALLHDTSVVIAGLNTPQQTVIAGEADAVARLVTQARSQGLSAVPLPVSHAFHSPVMADAVPALAAHLAHEPMRRLQRPLVSTVTGAVLPPEVDVRALLAQQVTAPVRFAEAIAVASAGVDLWLEVGPGSVLSGLLAACVACPVVAIDAGSASLQGLLQGLGAAFALGAPLDTTALFAERFTRPFDLERQPRFLVNPCELAPRLDAPSVREAFLPPPIDLVAPTPERSALEIVRELVAARAELPLHAVRDDSRLLSDLHLNSITVGQVNVEVARRLGLAAPLALTDYAMATVAGVAQALEDLRSNGVAPAPVVPAGVETWVRPFTVALVERPVPRGHRTTSPGPWQVVAAPGHPLLAPLQRALSQAHAGSGVMVCLPPEPDEAHLDLLLQGARAVDTMRVASEHALQFVLVQHGGGAEALARTLHLEMPDVATCVVNVPPDHPHAVDWVLAEIQAGHGYTEAHYDASGQRRVPVWRHVPLSDTAHALPLGPQDVLLVTGGGKGIAALCALALAQETGVWLALLGRSRPETDMELAAHLARLDAARLTWRYLAADVTDAEAVRRAVRDCEACLGPVTAVLHGAGANTPQRLATLDVAACQRTLAPKVQGLQHVLAVVNPARLRLVVAFGSIIARTGMRGEADYALANAWLARLMAQMQAAYPACRWLTVEWSVWSELGMGARLGRLDALRQEGITPIAPAVGIALLRRLLTQPLPDSTVVVTGRFGDPPTVQVERPELPLWRFLEQPRNYYPGVELVVDVEVSGDTDPYLDDHVFQGERLWPAVLGLEAMAQVAMALAETDTPPQCEDVVFAHPVVIPDGASVTLRLAALRRESGQVDVVVRSSATNFQAEHFRATCRWDVPALSVPCHSSDLVTTDIILDPQRELYGSLLFQRGRFQRLSAYHHLQATSCLAVIGPQSAAPWFGRYLPPTLVLGDPGARDATIHAIQACIPHGTIVPTGIERLIPGVAPVDGPLQVWACEQAQHGETFIYDLEVRTVDGRLYERWEGLQLRQVGVVALPDPCPAPLWEVYCERQRRAGESG